jgi:hypothetical protein
VNQAKGPASLDLGLTAFPTLSRSVRAEPTRMLCSLMLQDGLYYGLYYATERIKP